MHNKALGGILRVRGHLAWAPYFANAFPLSFYLVLLKIWTHQKTSKQPINWMGAPKIYTCTSISLGQ